MLWLLVIVVIGGLLFVMLHKPHVNSMGVGWIPPEQRQVAQPPPAVVPEATVANEPASMPAQLPGTFNYDSQAASRPRASTEQPHT